MSDLFSDQVFERVVRVVRDSGVEKSVPQDAWLLLRESRDDSLTQKKKKKEALGKENESESSEVGVGGLTLSWGHGVLGNDNW